MKPPKGLPLTDARGRGRASIALAATAAFGATGALSASAVSAIVLLGLSCGGRAAGPSFSIDLQAALPQAVVRAGDGRPVRMDLAGPAGDVRPAIVLPAPSRVTWEVRMPVETVFDAAVWIVPEGAAGVLFRVGLADDRAYQDVLKRTVVSHGDGGAWQPVRVDLAAYSGWKWSLFYRPGKRTWRLIVNADPAPSGTIALSGAAVTERSLAPR